MDEQDPLSPYSEAEAQLRFEAALRGSVVAGPKPLKDVPPKRAKSKVKKPTRASS